MKPLSKQWFKPSLHTTGWAAFLQDHNILLGELGGGASIGAAGWFKSGSLLPPHPSPPPHPLLHMLAEKRIPGPN